MMILKTNPSLRTWLSNVPPIYQSLFFLLLFIPSKRDMLMIIGIGGTIEYLKSNDTANKSPDKVIMAIDKLLDDTIEEGNE